jgi:hypothetical protein
MKFWQDCLKKKVVLEDVFHWQKIVCLEFIPEVVTVKDRYKDVLACLLKVIQLKHPKMWVTKDWFTPA